ncbi:hypothetical protein J3R82DRAFT_4901 [Butyriboletus roseoflavus]|nr:hypothetical protein J3R82DRAFT_4901 [Butyriboletus roseoflavus]
MPDGEWQFRNLAILKLYSEPDRRLLELSFQVVAASKLLNKIIVTDVKNIRSVVAMIPKKLTLPGSALEDEYFCMVEKPGLDISDLGVPYSIYTVHDNDDSNENDVE